MLSSIRLCHNHPLSAIHTGRHRTVLAAHQEGFPVLFKQFPDRDLFFIMEFGSFLFMAGKQLLVILLYLIEMRDRDKQVRTVIINLALHISFLPAGIGIAEAHPEV